MSGKLVLSGGDSERDLEFKRSEVNHLRQMLEWFRCEFMLDEDMQRGYANGAREMVALGFSTEERATEILVEQAAKIRHVPEYVRHSVKMLTKMIREHDKASGVVDVDTVKMIAAGGRAE